jgi:hypothetical protein
MHSDDIDWADTMEQWKLDRDNKKNSKAGDDRSPAFRWIGNLYRDESGAIIMPTDNIMRCIMEGASMVLVPGGRGGKTFKSQSQSGVMPRAIGWELLSAGKRIDTSPLIKLMQENDFAKHEEAARGMGFTLFKKRAKIGQSKHVRVRPRFDQWSASGELVVVDEQITDSVLYDILDMAGKYKGLGDWRPGSKTPGTFGMFTATVKRLS